MITAKIVLGLLLVAVLTATGVIFAHATIATEPPPEPGITKLPITFTGGYDTDPRDGGRPIILVAAGLNVTPEVFRKAFSGVTPARGGPPEPAQVRRNKEALMRMLAPLGVTNDRLDEVSNWYRYRPESGELWNHRPAKAYAKVKDGLITGFDIPDPGAGYSSPPTATIPGMPDARIAVTLSYGTDLQKNGSVGSLETVTTQPAK